MQLKTGVRGVVILDGRKPRSILKEIFSDQGAGTLIKKMKDLLNIKYWLFDLDNTLYSGDTKVFDQVDKRMSEYISSKLNVSIEEAKKYRKIIFMNTIQH